MEERLIDVSHSDQPPVYHSIETLYDGLPIFVSVYKRHFIPTLVVVVLVDYLLLPSRDEQEDAINVLDTP